MRSMIIKRFFSALDHTCVGYKDKRIDDDECKKGIRDWTEMNFVYHKLNDDTAATFEGTSAALLKAIRDQDSKNKARGMKQLGNPHLVGASSAWASSFTQ